MSLVKDHVQDPVPDPAQEKLHTQHKKLRHEIVQEHAENHIAIKASSWEPVLGHRRPG